MSAPQANTGWLAVVYYYPPMGTVAAQRNFHLLEHLVPPKERKGLISARYHYRQHSDLVASWPLFPVLNIDFRCFQKLLKTGSGGTGRRGWLGKALDTFPWNLLVGEGGLCYILAGYRRGVRLIESGGIGYLYSSYRTHSDHVIAALLKRRYPHLFWMADFADLPVDPVYQHVNKVHRQRSWIRRIIAGADLVTTVSEGLARQMQQYHPRVSVLPNGVSSEPQPVSVHPHDRFTLTYTGSLYGHRSPERLFRVIRTLLDGGQLQASRLQLVYAGMHATRWCEYLDQYALQDLAVTHGLVDQATARELQWQSDVNILLTWSSEEVQGWMTYKVYEYLEAGKPILSLVHGTYDEELWQLINNYGSGIMIADQPDSRQQLEAFLLQRYRTWEQKAPMQPANRKKFHEDYGWNRLVANIRLEIDLFKD